MTVSYRRSFDFIAIFGYFHKLLTTIHVWIVVSSPNFHRLCINVHILVCQHAKCDSRLWKVLWYTCVFQEFLYIYYIWIWNVKLHIKLLQGRSVGMKVWVLGYFSVTTIFATSRKSGPRPKWTIYKHISDNSSSSSSICSASTAYTSLCRGLKYLLKVRYIISNHPNVARFLSEKYIKNFNGIWVW